jgi:hypothetical protein
MCPAPALMRVPRTKAEVDVIFCSSALFVQPGVQMISERDDQYIFVSQHNRKRNVM